MQLNMQVNQIKLRKKNEKMDSMKNKKDSVQISSEATLLLTIEKLNATLEAKPLPIYEIVALTNSIEVLTKIAVKLKSAGLMGF